MKLNNKDWILLITMLFGIITLTLYKVINNENVKKEIGGGVIK